MSRAVDLRTPVDTSQLNTSVSCKVGRCARPLRCEFRPHRSRRATDRCREARPTGALPHDFFGCSYGTNPATAKNKLERRVQSKQCVLIKYQEGFCRVGNRTERALILCN